MGTSVRLELVVPPLVITFELAFLITVLTVFNVVELLVAHIDLGVLNENVPLIISFPQWLAIDAAISVVQKEGIGETGDWKQPLWLACYVSL